MTDQSTTPLIPPRFLFRFSAPLHYKKPLWGKKGAELDESFRLVGLAALDGREPSADVRGAWSEEGLAFWVRVAGKRQPVWCRDSRPDDSDGLQVWIDTRDTHNVHRATRFCHRFVMLPAGGGPKYEEPAIDQMIIDRARENARPVRPKDLFVASELRADGYIMSGFLPAAVLTGFDPAEHPKLGFTYALLDRERGIETFSVGEGFPYQEDPSTWATLEMVAK